MEERHRLMGLKEIQEEILEKYNVEIDCKYISVIKSKLGLTNKPNHLQPEHKQYILDNYLKYTFTELTTNLNEEFGTKFSRNIIYTYARAQSLGEKKQEFKARNFDLTYEMQEYIDKNIKDSINTLQCKLIHHFGYIPIGAIRNYVKSKKIDKARSTVFNPYHKGYGIVEHNLKMKLDTLKDVIKNTNIEFQMSRLIKDIEIDLSYSRYNVIKSYEKDLIKLNERLKSPIKKAFIEDVIICIKDL